VVSVELEEIVGRGQAAAIQTSPAESGAGRASSTVVGGPLGGVLVVAAGDVDGLVAHHGQQAGRQLLASVVKRNPGP
jgi:hypothetical protein